MLLERIAAAYMSICYRGYGTAALYSATSHETQHKLSTIKNRHATDVEGERDVWRERETCGGRERRMEGERDEAAHLSVRAPVSREWARGEGCVGSPHVSSTHASSGIPLQATLVCALLACHITNERTSPCSEQRT